MYANTTSNNGVATFDPKADFINSENTYGFTNEKNDIFWMERFNFYRPTPSGDIDDGYTKDITNVSDMTIEKKRNLFNYIVELYDNLTGSSLSPFLYFSESKDDTILYMWKKDGITAKNNAARNIITDGMPIDKNDDGAEKNNYIKVVGIYYMDSNGDFNIYTEQSKNYTNYYDHSVSSDGTITLMWNWEDTNTEDGTTHTGSDQFTLDTNFEYKSADGSKVKGAIKMKNSYDVIKDIEVVLNRLPKTFKKSSTALKTLYSDSKVLMRLNNLSNPMSFDKVSANKLTGSNSIIKKNALQQSLIRANKIAARSSFDVKAVKTATVNQIEPKIQATYGFADFGKIRGLNIDDNLSMDDGSYVTTHKIGYEELDRFRLGLSSCDSFLFLSPLNHSEIQVNGDTNRSHVSIKSNESLRVPIVYQYRMEDYNGSIFGNSKYKSTDAVVKNTKYANIIGIDIWLNTLSDTPKQYDIVVYSTYNKSNDRTSGVITKKLK
jgi:hypothetical protein